MEESRFFTNALVLGLSRIFLPLDGIIKDDNIDTEALTTLLYSLGWKVDPSQIPVSAFSDIISSMKELNQLLDSLQTINTEEITNLIPEIYNSLDTVITSIKRISSLSNFNNCLNNATECFEAKNRDGEVIPFFQKFMDLLISESLKVEFPSVYGFLTLLGIIENHISADNKFSVQVVHWEAFPDILSNPTKYLYNYYFSNPENDFIDQFLLRQLEKAIRYFHIPGGFYEKNCNLGSWYFETEFSELNSENITRIDYSTKEIRIPIVQFSNSEGDYGEIGVIVGTIPPLNDLKKGLAIILYTLGTIGKEWIFPLSEEWELTLDAFANADEAIAFLLRPEKELEIKTNLETSAQTATSAKASLTVSRAHPNDSKLMLFGTEDWL